MFVRVPFDARAVQTSLILGMILSLQNYTVPVHAFSVRCFKQVQLESKLLKAILGNLTSSKLKLLLHPISLRTMCDQKGVGVRFWRLFEAGMKFGPFFCD